MTPMQQLQLSTFISEIKARELMFYDEPTCQFEKLSEIELSFVLDGLRFLQERG